MNRPRRAPKKPTGPPITIVESAQMMQNIRTDPGKRISREQGTQVVREFFTCGELSVEYKQVSLVCPNSSKRIVDPVRGVNCTHLECFDLAAYLEVQVSQPYWQCPRCQQRVEADDLRID
ncbi:E3 SUMO-protein ligase PIAS3, partial [Aphelenchoides avenae]